MLKYCNLMTFKLLFLTQADNDREILHYLSVMNFHTLSYTETVRSWRCAGNSGRRQWGTFSCKVEKFGWSGFLDWHSNESRDSCIFEKNSANLHFCTLNKTLLNLHVTNGKEFPLEVLSLKQSIFDILGDVRRTPYNAIGHQSRVTVKSQFSKETFDCTFLNKGIPNIEKDDSGNVDCHITVDDVSKVFGENWIVRGYKTSTETFVS